MRKVDCDEKSLAMLRKETSRHPGLIVAGQGGSATRAADHVVKMVGTYDFGRMVNTSGDSLASRWSGVLGLLHKDGLLPRVIAATTHQSVYNITTAANLSDFLEIQTAVCRTVLMARKMRHNSEVPWGLKEPLLRLLLPFFDEVIGPKGYKLVHVTRDVRKIRTTHGTERFAFLVGLTEELLDAWVDKLRKDGLGHKEDSSLPKPSMLEASLQGTDHIHARHGVRLGYNIREVRQLIKFAYAWGMLELPLKHEWQRDRPHQYFHISEKKMDPLNENRSAATARNLSRFLGKKPSPELVQRMTSVYKPQPEVQQTETTRRHWEMMQDIVNLHGMKSTRQALIEFGYI